LFSEDNKETKIENNTEKNNIIDKKKQDDKQRLLKLVKLGLQAEEERKTDLIISTNVKKEEKKEKISFVTRFITTHKGFYYF
jgi:hypothetical protein